MKRLFKKVLFNQRGCFGGSPSVTPLPAPAPQQAQGSVKLVEAEEERRRRAAASNTMLTAQKTTMPKMQPKSLLGS